MLGAFPSSQPLHGLIGGLLIGLAGALMLLGLGRIAGVSGIAARASGLSADMPLGTAWAFLVGLPIGALLIARTTDWHPASFASTPLLVAAGLLVGFGTRLGSGCTSGHGVCGISRLSQRSLVATATFIIAGVVTVSLLSHIGTGR
jgi:uncharacterized membrane protein YedE/YeeE